MNTPTPARPSPLRNSYWVVPGKVLAGEHPNGTTVEATRERLQRLMDAGVECFIDLTEPGEVKPYDPELPFSVEYLRKPVRDHGIPAQRAHMAEILDCIHDALQSGRCVYIHCRAGIGRTGTVVGCLLVERGLEGETALDELNRLWQHCERSQSWASIPETDDQVAYVRKWKARAVFAEELSLASAAAREVLTATAKPTVAKSAGTAPGAAPSEPGLQGLGLPLLDDDDDTSDFERFNNLTRAPSTGTSGGTTPPAVQPADWPSFGKQSAADPRGSATPGRAATARGAATPGVAGTPGATPTRAGTSATGVAHTLGGTSTAGTAAAPGGASTAGTATAPGGASTAGTATAPGGTSAAGTTTAPGGTSTVGTATARGGTSAAGTATASGGTSTAGAATAPGGTSTAGTATARGGTSTAGTTTAPGGTSTAGTATTPGGTFTAGTATTPGGTFTAGTATAPGSTSTAGTATAPRDTPAAGVASNSGATSSARGAAPKGRGAQSSNTPTDAGSPAVTREPTPVAVAPATLVDDPLSDPAALSAARNLRDRFLGALLGLAVGDAVSAATQYRKPGTFTPVGDMIGGGPFDLPRGGWSDDTAMALCLADSLLERNGADPRDQMERYRRWQQEGYLTSTGQCVGITASSARAIAMAAWRRGALFGSHDPSQLDPEPLSRVAPAVMFFFAASGQAVDQATEAARTTCQAPAVLDACRSLARALHAALSGQPKAIVLEKAVQAIGNTPGRTATGISASAALTAAVAAFGATANFRDAILYAANLGGDSDVITAVCGQLAGAYYSVKAIPTSWHNGLMQKELIVSYADRLLTHAMLGLSG